MRAEAPIESPSSGADAATQPDVSVIIASWNARRHLVECLRSLAADDGALAAEIVVVDNASTDGSPDAVEQEFPDVTLVRNPENVGFARANNTGIGRAAGRYICLMNSDVVARRAALGALVRFMDARPEVGLVGPRILNPDGTLQPSCRNFPGFMNALSSALAVHRLVPNSRRWSNEEMGYWKHDEERSVDAVTGCFCVARREAVEQVGLLDEKFFFFSEDIDWCMRFRAAGWEVRFCPDAEAVHVRNASWSAASVRFAVEKERSRLHLYRKHYGRIGVAYFMALSFLHHALRAAALSLLYAVQPANRRSLHDKIAEHVACLRWMLSV